MRAHHAFRSFQTCILAAAVAGVVGLSPAARAADESEEGFVPIFNGKDLTGWDGDPKFWSVEDGAITGRTTPENKLQKNTFIFWRQGTVDDFILRLSYRIVNGNSGIQYRSREQDDYVCGGYQADFEAGDRYSGILYEERGRGILALRGQEVEIQPDGQKVVKGSVGDSAEIQANIKKEDWNDYEIIARGNKLVHKINGMTTQITTDLQKEKRAMSGLLAFQCHVGPPMTVQFKDVRLKRLPLSDGRKKVVFLAGTPSHAPGDHEFNAGCKLLASCLQKSVPGILPVVYENYRVGDPNHPQDPTRFDNADALVYFMNGGGGHPIRRELERVDALMKKGVGLACLHYAVEVPKGKDGGGAYFLDWIGGYFETHYSVNPHWTSEKNRVNGEHPIGNGVEPFAIRDEWYFNMRFRPDMEGVTPIYSAVPPPETMKRPDGPHSGNPIVREMVKKGVWQHLAWAAERDDGGRGFGFTGAHSHENWGNDDFRKLVLNAIVWIAKQPVPDGGVDCEVSEEDLQKNLDDKGRRRRQQRQRSAAVPPGRPVFRSDVLSGSKTAEVNVELGDAKNLWLVATDGGDGFGCDWCDWIEPRLEGPKGELKLTELKWQRATSDWGSVRKNRNAGGGPLRVGGKPVAYGIGTHANSVIQFELPPGYTRFKARCGLDNGGTDQGCGSTVRFSVYTTKPPATVLRPTPARRGGGGGPLEPVEAMQRIEVHDGLALELFAHEPMVANPTNIDIDARGRVWVTEGVNYRRWSNNKPEGDRIVILEDIDGDARADRSKVYYQDPSINSALGICVLGNRVIVSCSPNVFIFTDEDGDDRPDKKEVFFTGIQGVQHDHGVHAFVFGPDGKLYFNMGNNGREIRRPDGEFVIDEAGNAVRGDGNPYRQGKAFRCNLDGSEFETLGHNFRNNYELCVDSFGTVWQSDNDDDGNRGVRINFVMEYGNYGYTDEMTGAGWRTPRVGMHEEIPKRHWHLNDPGVVPNFVQTGAGSPTGICVYEGRLLPEVFHNEVIHCDAGPNVVRAYKARRDGAGYRPEIVNLLHGVGDRWFRPSDVCVAPDGSLLVSDWYDAGVGGHNMADRDPETVRGRIYRVAPPSHSEKYRVPRLDLESPRGAVAALTSPNLATRYLAWQALESMGEEAVPALERLARSERPRLRARALQLRARIPGRAAETIRTAIADSHPDIRITGLRIARDLDHDVLGVVAKLADDPSPAVRRECLVALRHDKSDRGPGLWAKLARQHDGEDRWYLEALGIASDLRPDACFQAWLAQVGDEWNTPAGRDIVWRSRSRHALPLLGKILLDPATEPDELPRYLRALDFHRHESKNETLVLLLTSDNELVAGEALERLKNFSPRKPQHRAIIERLLASSRGTPRYVELVDRFKLSGKEDELLEHLVEHAETSAGATAARLLLAASKRNELRKLLLGEDEAVAQGVAVALGNSSARDAVPLLLEALQRDASSLSLRTKAVRGLSRTRAGAEKLLELVRRDALGENLQDAAAVSLSAVPWNDLRQEASKRLPLPPTRDGKPLRPISELARERGDPGAGRAVFEAAECAGCHKVGELGKDVGPALTEIGDKLPKEELYLAILDPNAGVSFDYKGHTIITRDGVQLVGVIVSETEDELTVKAQGGILTTVKKSDILDRQAMASSLMPAGLQGTLTERQLIDLVEFLATRRRNN